MKLPHGKRCTLRPLRLSVALAASLLLVAVQTVSAQRVSIDFDDYHGYEGTVDYIRDVAGAYSNITELIEIGQSNMNRPVYVLVISRMNNGTTIDRHVELRHPRGEGVDNVTPLKSYHGKPGIWIDGGTHGNEYTGTEVSLYIIDKLVSGYGSDSDITQLIDDNAFYICPIVNPDGVYNSVERGISQRQNSMEVDDDEDGQVNEDGPDDLNGDDLITSFRYPDPEGRYVMDDTDPRVMIRLDRGEETDKPRYSEIGSRTLRAGTMALATRRAGLSRRNDMRAAFVSRRGSAVLVLGRRVSPPRECAAPTSRREETDEAHPPRVVDGCRHPLSPDRRRVSGRPRRSRDRPHRSRRRRPGLCPGLPHW